MIVIGILLTGLTTPNLRACMKPGHGSPMSYVVIVFCVKYDLMLEVVVGFVDIGGIVDHYCILQDSNSRYLTDIAC